MPLVKVLARDWTLEVDDGLGTSTFVEIGGITSFTFSSTKKDADTRTFDSGGNEEHIVVARGKTLGAEGKYLEDPATGDRDAGQKRIEAVAELVGQDSVVPFRLTSPGGTIKTFNGSVNMRDIGGGNDDPTNWGFDITVSGAVTTT